MFDVVIPTIGRPSLAELLRSLALCSGPRPERIFVVDDRREPANALDFGALDTDFGALDADFAARITILTGPARGPAAARNAGWRASRAAWVAFLDDDVVVGPTWLAALAEDLAALPAQVAGSTGIVRVPLTRDREATDWERNVAGLAKARWITADCAYRRRELLATGGFDERFPRAYREDADLALRVVKRGKEIVRGSRAITHPVRPAPWSISIRLQAGNADDVLMDALHGSGWRERAGAPRGAFRSHAFTVATAALAFVAAVSGFFGVAAPATAAWLAQTAAFAWRRIAPGPRTRAEIGSLILTSFAIPFAAVYHRGRGLATRGRLLRDRARAPRPIASAVLFDRDGTLIVDVPYNADPARVVPMPAAHGALARLREAGIATAVVTNQAGVALGRLRPEDVRAINERAESLLGPLGPVFVCAHGPEAGCGCRKPAPGLIIAAARALGVSPRDCVVVGDIGTDVEAARAAGARAILVATPFTRPEEIAAAPLVASDLDAAVSAVLGGAA
jgi:histidinol-phosphate phosphatase family protein